MSDTPRTTRRISVSDLKRDKKALKKAIRKATRRRDTLIKLRKENSELNLQLSRLREFSLEGY